MYAARGIPRGRAGILAAARSTWFDTYPGRGGTIIRGRPAPLDHRQSDADGRSLGTFQRLERSGWVLHDRLTLQPTVDRRVRSLPQKTDRSAAGFCGACVSGARSIRGSARLADVECSDSIADVHLVNVDKASVFDHSTHLGTGFVGKPTAPQVFCRSAYKSRVIPKHLGCELLSRSHILRKLLKGSITKDKVNVSRRIGERMLLKLIMLHLIPKPSIWFLAKDSETRSHNRARTVLARPINEQNGVRLFEKAIDIVHSLGSLQRESRLDSSLDLLNRRAEQKLRMTPEQPRPEHFGRD